MSFDTEFKSHFENIGRVEYVDVRPRGTGLSRRYFSMYAVLHDGHLMFLESAEWANLNQEKSSFMPGMISVRIPPLLVISLIVWLVGRLIDNEQSKLFRKKIESHDLLCFDRANTEIDAEAIDSKRVKIKLCDANQIATFASSRSFFNRLDTLWIQRDGDRHG